MSNQPQQDARIVEVRVPALPESVQDATVTSWHRQVGEQVQRDEVLVDIETDKVVFEIPAPVAGVIREIRFGDGALVTADEVLAVIEEGGAAAAPVSSPVAVSPEAGTRSAVAQVLSPAVRRLVEEHQLDPAAIPGAGKDGRITKADVLAFLNQEQAVTAPVSPPVLKPAPAAQAAATEARAGLRREPMSRIRARIAERMVEAQRTAAILTTFNEVDLGAVMALRKRYKTGFEQRHGVKLGFMSFFVKAVAEALARFPLINASIEAGDILYHDYYDIGVAVSTDRGLVVPVLRDADRLGFADIERQINDFASRAREARLTMDELEGGTFTITNGGVFGSMLSTPILNPPQSAVLGMHKIQDRPVAVDGQVVIRPMMYLALSYDHRLIDGKEAVQFLVAIKESLEDPARLLLEV